MEQLPENSTHEHRASFLQRRAGRIKLSIKVKLLIGFTGLAIVSCLSMGIVSYVKAAGIIKKETEKDLANVAEGLVNLCRTSYQINQSTVNSNLNVADSYVKGKTDLNRRNRVSFKAVNQITQEKYPVKIPAMKIGGKNVSKNFKLVDKITSMIGGTVTIFQLMDSPRGLLRISTSVKKKDGSRAVGTFIPPTSPVYRTIVRGKIFRGVAFVVTDWYITAYKPIVEKGKIIGAVYVGVKQSEMKILKNKVLSTNLGKLGKSYIIDNHKNSRGNLVIHPSRGGENILEEKDAGGNSYVKELIEKKNGIGIFNLPDKEKGGFRKKYIHYRYIDEMDWIIVAEKDHEEMYASLYELRDNMLITSAICLVFIVFFSILFSKNFSSVAGRIVNNLKTVSLGDLTKEMNSSDLKRGDEFGEMSVNFSFLIQNFRNLLQKMSQITYVLVKSIQELTVSAKEVSTTSNQQAAAVKEIVSTMEDSDRLSKNVAQKINEVAKIANQSKTYVDRGFALIKENMEKMEEIKGTNEGMIMGIRSLVEKIESIWEVVNIINSIADQTKIIAFNAELEASAAGEAGKNFLIVASEVRRLADNTVASTNEIRAKINEIQRSSDSLVLSSEEGTERIREGYNLSQHQREVFEDILQSSEISATSAAQIVASVDQQVAAFEQILLTLKQISEGIDGFVGSTKSTTQASEDLTEISDDLKQILTKYIVE